MGNRPPETSDNGNHDLSRDCITSAVSRKLTLLTSDCCELSDIFILDRDDRIEWEGLNTVVEAAGVLSEQCPSFAVPRDESQLTWCGLVRVICGKCLKKRKLNFLFLHALPVGKGSPRGESLLVSATSLLTKSEEFFSPTLTWHLLSFFLSSKAPAILLWLHWKRYAFQQPDFEVKQPTRLIYNYIHVTNIIFSHPISTYTRAQPTLILFLGNTLYL